MAIPRRFLLGGGAALGAAALFAGGALAGAALTDSGDSDAPGGGSPVAPGLGSPLTRSSTSPTNPAFTGAPEPAGSADDASFGRGGGYGTAETAAYDGAKFNPGYQCPAAIAPSVLGTTIDPASAGFTMSLLGQGYTLQYIALRAEGECDENGQAKSSHLVLDTTWRHTATGFDVTISQAAGGDPIASILYTESAEFSLDGYNYRVFVNSYRYFAEDAVAIQPPTDGPDPRVQAVLVETISSLAPALDQQCFYTQRQGDWADLAALGIGDPRGALPSGLTQNWFNLLTLNDPARDCDGPEPAAGGSQSFNVSFNDESDGWVGIDVYRLWPEQANYPGYFDQYSVNWNNATYQFNVYGNRNGQGLGQDALAAIARALDPAFSSQCLVTERVLSVAEVQALGFLPPTIPSGFTFAESRFTVNGLADGCSVPSDYEIYTSYYLSWTLRGEDGTEIGINVNRTDGVDAEPGDPPGYIGPNSIWWTGSDGTYYSIWASSIGISPTVDPALLAGIATSLDPNLDIDSLGEEPAYGGSPEKPLPVR